MANAQYVYHKVWSLWRLLIVNKSDTIMLYSKVRPYFNVLSFIGPTL